MSSTPPPLSSYLPEQRFFSDPALDRLMAVTMTLAAEVHILRERVGDLENAAAGGAGRDDGQAQAQDAADFVSHLLAPLLGEQQAKGPL